MYARRVIKHIVAALYSRIIFCTTLKSGAPLDILKMFANLLSQTALSNTFSAFQKQLNFYATQNIGEKSEIFSIAVNPPPRALLVYKLR